MEFTVARLQELLVLPGFDAGQQAKLDSLACEERVSETRLASYQAFLGEDLHPDAAFDGTNESWAARHRRYFQQRVAAPDSVTFAESDEWTARPTIAEEDWIIRVERIDSAFHKWESEGETAVQWLDKWTQPANTSPPANPRNSGFANLRTLLGRPAKPEPTSAILEIFDYWNGSVRVDHRPSFVAFEAELKDDLAASDWAERLCVRLGLGHHFFGSEVTLAVLRYQVNDVLATCQGQIGFCAPTVLDSEFSDYFHPAPRACDWGFAATLDAAAGDESLVAELLHRRIDYRPEHLLRVGTVNRAPVADLLPLRNAHVGRLRRQSGRDDFGILR